MQPARSLQARPQGMKQFSFPWRSDSHTVWPIQGRPEYGGFRVPECDTGGHSPSKSGVFPQCTRLDAPMAAMASMACQFWVQFGVVMMADVSTAKENVKRVFY